METIRNLLREHGAAQTKALLDQAIREEVLLLETRIQEMKIYMSSSPPERPLVSSPEHKISPEEAPNPLQQDEPKKAKRVKPTPNSNRVHPIARAKAAKAEAKPETPQPAPLPESSETDKKPPRGVLKAEQRKKENAKRKELEEAGISPSSLLTKENLQQWLSVGKTYSQIAREEVGMREEDVSAAAKKHGLSSQKTQKLTGRENVIVTKEQQTPAA
jgi:hypothetical protein